MAKWEMMRKTRIEGSYEFDNTAKCLPPGMPAMMNMAYGMEVMQGKDRITFFSELNDAIRRVYHRWAQANRDGSGRSNLRRILDRTLGRRHAGRRDRRPALEHRSSRASHRTVTR